MRKGPAPVIIILVGVALIIAVLFSLVGIIALKNADFVKGILKEFTTSSSKESKETKWQVFNSVDGHFKILVPSYPEKEEKVQTIPNSTLTVKQIIYSSSLGETDNYTFAVAFYPDALDVSDPKKILEGVVNGSVSVVGNNSSLIASEYSSYKNNTAVNAYFKGKREGISFGAKMKAILVGRTLYMMIGVSTIDSGPKDYERFVNSFELL